MAKITTPNKSTGDTHSAAEYNEVKASVNALYTTSQNHSTVLTFDFNKSAPVIIQTAAIAYSLATSGNIDGVVIRHKITSNGVNTITFPAGFNVFNKSEDNIYPAGQHIFYFNFVGGEVDVVIPTYSEVTTTPTEPTNTAPSSYTDSYNVNENETLTVNAANGVLSNDTDVDGNPITATLIAPPTNGTLTLNADGSFTYSPALDYIGSDSFTYKANDGTVDGTVTTVSITVNVPTATGQKLDIYNLQTTAPASPLVIPSSDGQGQGTHPDVIDFGTSWNGYRYWMVYTPYTNGTESEENPEIIASNDKLTWVVPNGLTNPITASPTDGSYWADTELLYDSINDRLICYYRGFTPPSNIMAAAFWQAKTSTDGVTWSAPITVLSSNAGASPAIIKEGSNFVMYDVDISTNPYSLKKRVSTNPLDFSTSTVVNIPITGTPSGKDIWHINLNKVGDFIYALVTVTTSQSSLDANLCFGVIENNALLINPTYLYTKTGTWFNNNIYRCAMVVQSTSETEVVFDMWLAGTKSTGEWQIGYTTITATYEVPTVAELSAVEATSPAFSGTTLLGGFSLKPDGASLLLSDGGASTSATDASIKEHLLSTARDITTMSTTVNKSYAITNETFANYNQLVDNGTKLLLSSGQVNGKFIKAVLSTPYDLSTGTFGYFTTISGRAYRALKMSPDGTKLYQAQVGNRDIHQYTLSTPYEITSKGTAVVYTHSATGFGAAGMDISNDGLTMVFADQVASMIRVLKLGTAWDITSVTEELNFPITGGTFSAVAYHKPTGAVYILNLDNRTIQKRTLTLGGEITPPPTSTTYDAILSFDKIENPSYTGASIQITYDNGTTFQEIGFVGDELDVSQIESVTNTALVNKIYDKSGNGNHLEFTVGSRPIIKSLSSAVFTQNGRPAIKFEVAGSRMYAPATLTGENGLSIFVVHYNDATTGNNRGLLGKWNGSTGNEYVLASFGFTAPEDVTFQTHNSSGVATSLNSGVLLSTKKLRLITALNNGATSYLRIDGVQKDSDAAAINASDALLQVGGYGNATNYNSPMYISEIRIKKGYIADFATIESALISKYSIV